jgi:hypothetical protein
VARADSTLAGGPRSDRRTHIDTGAADEDNDEAAPEEEEDEEDADGEADKDAKGR